MEQVQQVTTNSIAEYIFETTENQDLDENSCLEDILDSNVLEVIGNRYLIGIKLQKLVVDDYVMNIPARTPNMQRYYNWSTFVESYKEKIFSTNLDFEDYCDELFATFTSHDVDIIKAQQIYINNGFHIDKFLNLLIQHRSSGVLNVENIQGLIIDTTLGLRRLVLEEISIGTIHKQTKLRLELANGLLENLD